MLNFEPFDFLAPLGTIWLVLDWIIRIGALFIVPKNRKPSSGTAWLLLIFFFPVFGALLFLIIGNPKLPKKRRQAQAMSDKVIASLLAEFQQNHDQNNLLDVTAPKKYQKLAHLSESLSNLPVFGGNKIEVLPKYDEAIKRITKDVDAAEYYVHLEYFIIVLDETTKPLFESLANAAQRGVKVRVLYDSLSTKRYPKWRAMLKYLDNAGIAVQPMLPLRLPGRGYVRPDLRNHRKLVVIDGVTSYTGSQNLVQRNYHRKDDIYYDELVVRIQGPITLQLAAVFLTDWYTETGVLLNYKDMGTKATAVRKYGNVPAQVLPSGPGYDDENNLMLFTDLIHSAEKEIIIVNPYFVPDDALSTAIISAAKRGVKVTMINSEAIDQWMVGHAQRSFYETLLKNHVNIWLYHAPVLLHSKFMTIDGEVAVIGSSNLDIRSFFLDLEVSLIAYDKNTVNELRKTTETYLRKSQKVQLKGWQKRPQHKKLLDNIARLTSALQ